MYCMAVHRSRSAAVRCGAWLRHGSGGQPHCESLALQEPFPACHRKLGIIVRFNISENQFSLGVQLGRLLERARDEWIGTRLFLCLAWRWVLRETLCDSTPATPECTGSETPFTANVAASQPWVDHGISRAPARRRPRVSRRRVAQVDHEGGRAGRRECCGELSGAAI